MLLLKEKLKKKLNSKKFKFISLNYSSSTWLIQNHDNISNIYLLKEEFSRVKLQIHIFIHKAPQCDFSSECKYLKIIFTY